MEIVGWERDNGDPVPLEVQSKQYKSICNSPDPDKDGEFECLNPSRLFRKI